MRYSIYAETLDPADLKAAAELYEMLSQESSNPRLQLQSLYKLGKCRELSDELEKRSRSTTGYFIWRSIRNGTAWCRTRYGPARPDMPRRSPI